MRALAPTRHLGANKGYASKNNYFITKTHTLFRHRPGGCQGDLSDEGEMRTLKPKIKKHTNTNTTPEAKDHV
jgi:hypothetical protein